MAVAHARERRRRSGGRARSRAHRARDRRLSRAFRLVRSKYQALDGEGARLYGGRWNSPGHAVVYLASSASLAALELLVHTNPEDAPDDLVILEIDIPDDATIDRVLVSALPADWRAVSAPPSCQELGDAWVEAGRALGISLPSVIMPTEHNILINPAHPDMRRLRVMNVTPFQFDPRLLG